MERSLETAASMIAKGDDLGWRKDAAFAIHQAVERAYICVLLVHTLYFPRSHNIKFLRSLAEDVEKRLPHPVGKKTDSGQCRDRNDERCHQQPEFTCPRLTAQQTQREGKRPYTTHGQPLCKAHE